MPHESRPNPVLEIPRWKAMVAGIRERARSLLDSGTPGVQIAAAIGEATDEVLLDLIGEVAAQFDDRTAAQFPRQGAVIAVGGSGRGDLAPYSDIDLLFLHQRHRATEFHQFIPGFVQICWDAKVHLGHATRDVATCLALAREDPQIATSLVEARLLWGNEQLFERLTSRFKQRVVDARRRQFIEDSLAARSEGWSIDGPAAQELEPDVKASSGGLRDLHLIRWVGFARYGVRDLDSLRLKGALSKTDARKLKDAWEFLTRLRIDLHLEAGRAQDRLTRDDQLRIAGERGFKETSELRAVEQFMREYFHHSSEIAAITRRFIALERPRSLGVQARDMLTGHRAEGIFFVGSEWIDVARRNLPQVCRSIESILRLYRAAALYGLQPSPRVAEAIKSAIPKLSEAISPESARLFLDILKCTGSLGSILRSMFSTGLLDVIIPDVARVRNLLQFNQYHHFTVDEHTLRAVEAVTRFEQDEGPLGAAYASIRHKEILHLAVLLHDLGKGFTRDHCVVGHDIALRIGARLSLPEHQSEQLALLVLKHLEMADVAFRRDVTDPRQVVAFSSEIGSPDTLRMLYVLTAADVTAVGPGTWTNWKAGLLTELFDRCLLILSGHRYSDHEQERIREVKDRVLDFLEGLEEERPAAWVDRQLSGFSSYYLTCTPPEQIAEDLRIIRNLAPSTIEVASNWNGETGTTEYRVITRNPVALPGGFHKMCGVLTAKRLEILSADINTTAAGVLVDSYRTFDGDYDGRPPDGRCEEIGEALRSVLRGEETVESLFHRHRRFGNEGFEGPVSDLPMRVKIDNGSSENRTIIDVFAHDRPGLLYTVTRTLFELGLSVDMAKIATHFDQVVDVFYVQDEDGEKLPTSERIQQVRDRLLEAMRAFEESDHRQFARSP